MLAKCTAKNQLTLPKAIVQATGEVDYYDISTENGRIVLTPMRLHQTEAVREKLASTGIGKSDIEEAIEWARKAH